MMGRRSTTTLELPIDIQCCSQALDTLVWFRELDPENVVLAKKSGEMDY